MSLKIIVLCFFVSLAANAQKEGAIWHFGSNAAIDFNSGKPVVLSEGKMSATEGCATISNSNGELLFYTNGIFAWDRNHNVMLNGLNLAGGESSSQAAMIIPKPGDSNIYYIFTVDDEAGREGLSYSEVDMRLNSGNGDITSNKNILLETPVVEKISAIKHGNGNDYWVVSHKWNSADFVAYKVTDSGVVSTPVISTVGSLHAGKTSLSRGCLKISPDGTRLALAAISSSGFVEIFDFNNADGVVSNPILLDDIFYNKGEDDGAYGLEFSLNSKILYVSDIGFSKVSTKIHQFDIKLNDATSIVNSDTILYEDTRIIAGMQLAIDKKIYLSNVGKTILDVIEYPNKLGEAAGYKEKGFSVRKGVSFGLPSFIQSFFNVEFSVEGKCFGDETIFTLTNKQKIDNVFWDFGDATSSNLISPKHIYKTPGIYTVNVKVESNGSIKKIKKQIVINEAPVANNVSDFIICDESNNGNEFFNLRVKDSEVLGNQSAILFEVAYFSSYENAEKHQYELPDSYRNTINNEEVFVKVYNKNNKDCYDISSFKLELKETPILLIDGIQYICVNDRLTLTADIGYDTYSWSTGEKTSSITVSEPGDYTVTVTKHYKINPELSCSSSKTIKVVESNRANFKEIEVLDWRQADNKVIVYVDGIGEYEYSLDDNLYQDRPVFENLLPGAYTVHVRDKFGCGEIEKDVFVLSYPKYFTPNGDDVNDKWKIEFANTEENMSVLIYDRYGKLIKQIDAFSEGWDGTFNGIDLPESDYWFVVKRPKQGKKHLGHFTLKR